MPRVSVIIPAYNVERYIDASMQSVLQQTHSDFELIVIDDGSTDGTAARAACHLDPRVRVVTQANRGLVGARNGGIRAARGELLAFLDADDLWQPTKLARHVAHLDARPQVGVSYCASAFIDDDAVPLGYYQRPQLLDVQPRDVFLRNPVGNGSAPVIRAAALRQIAFVGADALIEYFDESFRQSEDIECWLRIALTTNWTFEGLAEPLTLYRVNPGGLSANLERQLESWERVVAKTAIYAPDFVHRWAPRARAFQLRYLARRAVRQGAATTALRLCLRALACDPAIAWQEPARTGSTLVAALMRAGLPQGLYSGLERAAMSLSGALGPRLPA